ncbi:MAG: 2-C-methyl-D-erythritol 4-phosphate cytidylyltransferase [Paludibacteraceae bacterium]|nr:2-C-methyl-D-erythritol 4-phosphate cytidylyltransferase [Paludibacteraceae bacterium]
MYNIAVILAGGIGARVGGGVPKQLLPLADGRSVLEHAVNAFEQSPHIHEVCIVMHPDYIVHAEQMLLANAWQKLRHIIPGGKERWESSVNAIRQVRGERLEVKGQENNCQLPQYRQPPPPRCGPPICEPRNHCSCMRSTRRTRGCHSSHPKHRHSL